MEQEKSKDLRIEIYDGELIGAEFQLKKFVPTKTNDHEHCYFCWQKITALDIENVDKEGYCTKTKREIWVCKECFNDFKKQFEFKLKT